MAEEQTTLKVPDKWREVVDGEPTLDKVYADRIRSFLGTSNPLVIKEVPDDLTELEGRKAIISLSTENDKLMFRLWRMGVHAVQVVNDEDIAFVKNFSSKGDIDGTEVVVMFPNGTYDCPVTIPSRANEIEDPEKAERFRVHAEEHVKENCTWRSLVSNIVPENTNDE